MQKANVLPCRQHGVRHAIGLDTEALQAAQVVAELVQSIDGLRLHLWLRLSRLVAPGRGGLWASPTEAPASAASAEPIRAIRRTRKARSLP